jgi:hypothetical protein
MIRNAVLADLPGMRACAERCHAKSVYSTVPKDVGEFAHTVGQCISNAYGFAMVAMNTNGEITGLMLGGAVPLWFSRKRYATDIITYCETPGDGVRMMKAFMNWAWTFPNVIEVTLAQSTGLDIERTGKLYERLGLEHVGALYTAVREVVAEEIAA